MDPVPITGVIRTNAAAHIDASESATASRRLSLASAVLLVVYGASLLLISLGGLVMTYHEVNYSEPAREMLRGAGWLMTRFGGQPFVEKPPLINWSIAAEMALFHSRAEWVTRLPSVFSAIASAWVIAAIGARWFGDRIGLYSGLIELTSMYVQAQGRRAEPDMMLCALVSAALGIFAFGTIQSAAVRPSRQSLPMIFYAAAGLSFLPKGPVGPALALMPCVWFALRDRASRKFLMNPAGICIFLLVVLAWPAALYLHYPAGLNSLWAEHTLRLSGAWGTQNWFFYLYMPLLLMLPWTPLVLSGAVAAAIEHWWTRPICRLMGLWFVLGTVFLSLSPFKHWHYMVPVLPPLSILGALGLERFLHAAHPRYATRMLGIAASLLAIPVVYYFIKPQAGAISVLVILTAAGLSIALYLQWRGLSETAPSTAVFATVWIVSVAAQLIVTPRFQSYLGQTQLARRVNLEVPAGTTLYLLGPPHNQMVFYLTVPVIAAGDSGSLEHRIDSIGGGRPIYILAPQSAQSTLAQFGAVQTLDRSVSLRAGETERDRLTLMKVTQK